MGTKERRRKSALEDNIEQMRAFVGKVEISPEYCPLRQVVADAFGLRKTLDAILLEVCHPYCNWKETIPRLRGFVLKNISRYYRHELGPQAFTLFSGIFFDALVKPQVRDEKHIGDTVESMLAYVNKLVSEIERDLPGLALYGPRLGEFFDRIRELDEQDGQIMMRIVQGHHPMKEVALKLVALAGREDAPLFDFTPMARLMKLILERNYAYWLGEDDPEEWFGKHCGRFCQDWEAAEMFKRISHQTIRQHLEELRRIDVDADPAGAMRRLLELPAHRDMVRLYRALPGRLAEDSRAAAGPDRAAGRFAENKKLLFLFRIMETQGLYLIHEESLREINRSLVRLIQEQSFEDIENFFTTTFKLLKANVRRYPHTALQCIQAIGVEVFKRGNSRLVEAFLWEVVRFGFQYARVQGVDEDWQPITNPSHLENIRVWLHLIMQEPKWCSTLFSALIINLKLSGTCVKDTDLFQRDITELLNHAIAPIYNLTKQFTKLMPVFFNEIGAEGELREVSTELDEIHKRRDRLIHFLRKQSHVESSNLIVGFIRAIFHFWLTLDKSVLEPFLPDEVLEQVDPQGPYVREQHRLALLIRDKLEFSRIEELLEWQDKEREAFLAAHPDISPEERRRFSLLVRMYRLLHQKYNLGLQELRGALEQAVDSGFPEMRHLLDRLESCECVDCLEALLDHLERLQEIVLSSERFEPKEDIFYKRHIAVDIPSVYGRYSERKFDALGLTFRLENLANVYLERLGQTVNLRFITKATFSDIVKCLEFFLRALAIDGIRSRRLDTYVALLKASIGMKRFSYTQYLDIFRGLSEGVKDVIYAYYTNIHENNLSIIIPQIGVENLLTTYRPLWDPDDQNVSVHRLSEAFFRDLIANTFGLQHLDNFISRILLTLEAQQGITDSSTLDLLMTYNPERAISSLYNENPATHDIVHLGNKGFNLILLANARFQVPPGLIITTEVFRCRKALNAFVRAKEEFMQRLREALTEVEEEFQGRYGDPGNLMLVSVRSGAAVSMPGMMTTIHNVGLNEEIVDEYVSQGGGKYFMWDNYRRFIQSWAMTQGMERDDFQQVMNEHKKRAGVRLKRDFNPEQMRDLALDYLRAARNHGVGIPEDPWQQLVRAVDIVLDSWDTVKAKEYRRLMTVSDDWGTAVIVQAMVYGNRGKEAGSGVLFTAHPYRKVRRVALWGDYATADQGEDIVSGLVTAHSISEEQARLDGRKVEASLEKRFPAIYGKLLEISRTLVYDKGWNPQEIEFTFESGDPKDLYLLQTRDMITIKQKEKFHVFEDVEDMERYRLGRGIGVSGSALSGRAVFTEEDISALRLEDPGARLILIRRDTVPDDIREISLADGLLTARGGQTSHASVVATRLEKTCVVGCKDLKVFEGREYCEIGRQQVRRGDYLSIDGRSGCVYSGTHPVREEVHILPL